MNDLVSIIVPVYNVEKYLERCIESLWAQTYDNYEIILIDDCSTDNSLDICYKLERTGRNIVPVLHHDSNRGLEQTRNSGLTDAKGEWIMFLDSDDTFTPDAVEKMVLFAKKNNCDMVFAPYNSIRADYTEVREGKMKDCVMTKSEFAAKCFVDIPYDVMNCVGAKIYKKSMIDKNNLRFDKQYKYNEDGAFMTRAVSVSQTIGYYNLPYYNYIRRDSDSIQSSYRPEMFGTIQKSRALMRDFLVENGVYSGERKNVFLNFQISLAFEALYNEVFYRKYGEFKKEFNSIIKSSAYQEFENEFSICRYKQKIMLLCLKFRWSQLYYFICKIIITARRWRRRI